MTEVVKVAQLHKRFHDTVRSAKRRSHHELCDETGGRHYNPHGHASELQE